MVTPLGNLPHETAFANSFINGGAASSSQPAQSAAIGAAGIIDRPAAGAARSGGHRSLLSDRQVRSQASAIEPCLVEEFTGLHVKAYRYETGLHNDQRRRPESL